MAKILSFPTPAGQVVVTSEAPLDVRVIALALEEHHVSWRVADGRIEALGY